MNLIRRTVWSRCSRRQLLSVCWNVTIVTVFFCVGPRLVHDKSPSFWIVAPTALEAAKLLSLELTDQEGKGWLTHPTNPAASKGSDNYHEQSTTDTDIPSKSSMQKQVSRSKYQMLPTFSSSYYSATATDPCPKDPTAVTTWDEVQRCLNGRKNLVVNQTQQGKKRQQYLLRLVGERHSGTKFIIGVIRSCFRSIAYIDANRDFTRSKHFFQVPPDPPDHPRINAKKYRYDDPTKVIVITVVRNPYDWVHAMIEQPYHTPYHVERFQKNDWPIPLTWQEYVARPWTMPRPSLDRERIAQNKTQGNICVLGMAFDEVIPCEIRPHELPQYASYREHIPVYELKRDGSGTPFSHVLEMRAAKIRNFVQEIPQWNIGGYLAVRYDDLLANGTELMLRQLAGIIGLPEHHLPKNCMPKGPQPERIGRRRIPSGLRTWIRENMDGEAERLVGFLTQSKP